ncbi:MAG: hypothetical protein E4H09_02130 [Spirochaetales bacterium]|nr:MAG: hypothetical protein E4H09_02130 [Spirochaetales bacterium]
MTFNVERPARTALEDAWVRLEPIGAHHANPLSMASQPEKAQLFHHLFFGPFDSVEDCADWIAGE